MYFSNCYSRLAAMVLSAALVAACGGGGSTSTPTPIPPVLPNVLAVRVDGGPADSGYNVNRLYTDVKICQPATAQCRIIDHVLVDTGSSGLRLLSSVITPTLPLAPVTGSSGLPLLNCVQFVDNTFAWGPVVSVDIVLGGKTATSVPIQIMADPVYSSPANTCSIGGAQMTLPSNLGANGILGVGLAKEDCGSNCVTNPLNGFYYTCSSTSCTRSTGAVAAIAKQVKNPVPLFASDNNGLLIDMPSVGVTNTSSLSGSIIFGIGTQSNNQLGSAKILTNDASGYIASSLRVPNNQPLNLSRSFIDSGSNGFYFDSSAVSACVGIGYTGFYCPDVLTTLSATISGANTTTASVNFSISNALTLFADTSRVVLPTLSGPFGDTAGFDWGLPFFYGRRVFVGIEGQNPSVGPDSYYAF